MKQQKINYLPCPFNIFIILILGCVLNLPKTSFAQNVSVRQLEGKKIIETYNDEKKISQVPVSFPGSSSDGKFTDEVQHYNSLFFNWELKFTAPGKVFKDVSFANPLDGYIVTELGAVYRTTNGGNNWTVKMNLGFPYYWYGVHALSPDTVVIAGFNNQGVINSGVVRWSFNGGNTWSNDIILRIPSGVGWLSKVHFFDQNRGIVMAEFSGGVHYTSTGGKDSLSWNYIQINSDLAWFTGNIDAQANGNVYTTGIHFAHSTNYGIDWTTTNSADNVFDGGVDFLEPGNLRGLTGGGQISSPVSGWVHRTTDGGLSWGDRLNTFDYPIRAVKFFNDSLGIAIGGNVFNESGGIHSTTNSGTNWILDVSTSAEMFSFDLKDISEDSTDIWCVGSTGGSTGFIGKLYKTRTGGITYIHNETETPANFYLSQNYPNPFNPGTVIEYSLNKNSDVKITLYDMLGKKIKILVNQKQPAGIYKINLKGAELPSGTYFYSLAANGIVETKRMVLLK